MHETLWPIDPPIDKVLYERCFPKGRRRGVFIECGALDGVRNSNCFFFEQHLGWHGVNLEPVPHLFEQLVANRPYALNLPFALSDKFGFQEIQFAYHPIHGKLFGNASLKHSDMHYAGLLTEGCSFRPIMVPIVPFGHLSNFFDISNIDLFSLDVEGHELHVLRSMFDSPARPKVFCVEIYHVASSAITELLQTFRYEIIGTHFCNLIASRKS